jgi:hypothetical protein
MASARSALKNFIPDIIMNEDRIAVGERLTGYSSRVPHRADA